MTGADGDAISVSRVQLPKLRFPEFRTRPDWESLPLSDFVLALDAGVSVNSGGRPAGSKELGVLKTSAVTTGFFDPSENKVVLGVDEKTRLTEPVIADTIIISRMNTPALVGANAYVEKTFHNLFLPDRLWAAKPRPHTSMRFLAFILGSDWGRAALRRLATGTSGSMKNISKPDVLDLRLSAPERAEQLKIAECLSTLDELIVAESQKLDALKAHKQGLLQHFFPCGGETAPRLRFPEFRAGPKWTTKRGGELFANRKEAGETGLPIYSVTMHEGMVPRASFDRDFYDIEDPAGNRKVCKGDIAYNMMRMWQGAQGVAPEDCLVSPAYVVLAPQEGVCAEFFAYYFKLPQTLELLTATSRGLTKDRLRLYFDDFARMRMCVPAFAEQQRITACLASLDELIAAHGKKREALETFKRYLMQQLFPATGQV